MKLVFLIIATFLVTAAGFLNANQFEGLFPPGATDLVPDPRFDKYRDQPSPKYAEAVIRQRPYSEYFNSSFLDLQDPCLFQSHKIHPYANLEQVVSYHAPERRESVVLKIDGQGQLTERTVMAWRADDRKIGRSKTYDSTGRLKWIENYIYDEHDKMVRIDRHDPMGTIIFQTHFDLDSSGKTIGTIVVNAEGNPVPPSEWDR